MKKIIIFVFTIIIFSAQEVYSIEKDKQYGFQDIPFGTPYNKVWGALAAKNVGLVHSSENDTTDTYFLYIEDYDLGGKEVKVTFYFDHNKEFYSFTFSTSKKNALRLESEVYIDGQYLTDVFTNKYGKPSRCYKPNILSISMGYVSYLCVWNHKSLEIYTGLTEYESEYYAVAIITSKKMEKAYVQRKEQKLKKDATEGAKKF
ncbi:MAG: hypothetical protein AB1668_07665 [Nanoarchaeota archaeon]